MAVGGEGVPMTNIQKGLAEFIGTFWLVFGGCGAAVLAAGFPDVGIGLLGVSLAFGLTVITMAYAIGHISGCHLNPAVTVGLWAGGRFDARDIPLYVAAQVLGGIAAAFLLYYIASGSAAYAWPPTDWPPMASRRVRRAAMTSIRASRSKYC